MIENKIQYENTKAKIKEIEKIISEREPSTSKINAAVNSLSHLKNKMKKDLENYEKIIQ